MGKTYDVAVVGAGDLVGEAILDLLASCRFPVGKVFALEPHADGEQEVAFGGKTLDIEALEDFDFSSVQLALFAASESVAAEYVPRAVAAGCIVIDDSTCFRGEDDVPLVVAEVNPDALSGYSQRKIVASPGSAVTQMLIALKPLHDVAEITRINTATYQAVSGVGRKGVDELARQTAHLLNARPLDSEVFPKQITFNILPVIGEVEGNGYTREEMKMIRETRKIMRLPELAVNPTAVRVPVFFGHAAAIHIETASKLSASEARKILADTPGVVVMDGVGAGAWPTPVTDAASHDAVYIGRVREDVSHPCGLDLWVVADNVRKGAALNVVQIAERLVRDYL
jgi:aspartate-semialdehyde dehydrogenase